MKILCATALLLLGGCTKAGPNVIQAKVFALTPEEHLGKPVHVSGILTRPGPGKAYFFLRDETGTVLVTTESLGEPFPCANDTGILAMGVVRKAESTGGTYVSITKVIDCRKAQEVAANP